MGEYYLKALIAVALLSLSGLAYATPGCDHPNFYVKGCPLPVEQGPQGEKGEQGDVGATGARGPKGDQGVAGRDGVDGKDGKAGADGAPGRDGIDGADGRSGLVLREQFRRYIALSGALDIHQSEQGHRVSVGAAGTGGTYGLGFGYSYRDDDDRIYKLGVGKSGSETLVKGSISLQF